MKKTFVSIGLLFFIGISYGQLIIDLNPGTENGVGKSFKYEDNILFNGGQSKSNFELWKTDGTAEGTVKVKELTEGGTGSEITGFKIIEDTLYFEVYHNKYWKTDGTEEGTILSNITYKYYDFGGLLNGVPFYFDNIDLGLFYGGIDENTATRLCNKFSNNFYVIDSLLFFVDYDGNLLWRSNGTMEGTYEIGSGFSELTKHKPILCCEYNGKLIFIGNNNIHGNELCISDGTKEGTHIIKDIDIDADDSNPTDVYVINNRITFFANNGKEIDPYYDYPTLWSSDGTEEGTIEIEIPDFIEEGVTYPFRYVYDYIYAHNKLYMVIEYYNKSASEFTKYGLVVSDGTQKGTILKYGLDDYYSWRNFGLNFYFSDSEYVYMRGYKDVDIPVTFQIHYSDIEPMFSNNQLLKPNWAYRMGSSIIYSASGNYGNELYSFKVEEPYSEGGKVTDLKNTNVFKNVELELYPNPSSTFLKINLDCQIYSGNIQIIDNDGRIIKQCLVSDVNNIIPIEYLKPGFYFLFIKTEENHYIVKFIKE